MFFHYLKTAWRSIRSNRVYTLLSICCLAIGTAMFSVLFYGINYNYYQTNRRPLYDRSAVAYEDMPGNEMYSNNRRMVKAGYRMPVSLDMIEKLRIPEIEYISASGNGSIPADFNVYDSEKVYYDGSVRGIEVCGDYFRFHNLTLLYGDRTPQNSLEIVVTESFLKKIGYEGDISQCQIKESHWNRDCSIVNVVKDDVWSKYLGEEIFFCLDRYSLSVLMGPGHVNCDVVLKEGVDIEDVNRLLSTSYISENSKAVLQLSHSYPKAGSPVSLLSVLVLLVAAANFFKHTAMLLKQRGRANIIRYSIGAGKKSLWAMLMVEIVTVLLISLALALYLSYHLCSWLNTARFLGERYFNYADLAALDIWGVCLTALAGMAVCIISVNKQNRLLRQRIVAEPRERKTLKHIIIGLETTVAVFAMAVALNTWINAPRTYNPLSKAESRRTFHVNSEEGDDIERFYRSIRELPQVDGIINSYGGWRDYPNYTMVRAGGRQYHFIIQGPDINYFSLFNIPIEWLDPVHPSSGFLIERKTYDELMAEGVDLNSLECDWNQVGKLQIAGIFDNLIGDDLSGYTDRVTQESIPMGNKIDMHRLFRFRDVTGRSDNEFFVKFNNSVSAEKAESLIREKWREVYPMSGDGGLIIEPLPEFVDEDFRFNILAFNLGSIICILLVILSVTSSVSADTNVRRKEVAMRKINGAKARDIMTLFIKPYALVSAIAFPIGIMASWVMAVKALNLLISAKDLSLVALITLVALVLIMLISVYSKIRSVMRTNPADVIKGE